MKVSGRFGVTMREGRTYRWDLAGEEGPSGRNDHD